MEEGSIKKPRFITLGDVEINLKEYERIHNDFCGISSRLRELDN